MAIRNMRSFNRQKYQRAVNKLVRELNKNIKNDWLWNGRFYMRQDWATFHIFDDRSGAQFNVGLVFKDTKTGREEYADFDNYDIEWKIGEWANRCITEIWDVWKEDPNPNQQARLEGRTPPKIF